MAKELSQNTYQFKYMILINSEVLALVGTDNLNTILTFSHITIFVTLPFSNHHMVS